MKILAVVNNKNKTIIFSKQSDDKQVSVHKTTFTDYDEWGSITLGETLYDFHIIVEDDKLNVYVYGLMTDEENVTIINCDEEYICKVVSDIIINNVVAYGRDGDNVNVTPHDDITEEFNGDIVGFKDDMRIVSVKDLEDEVWDCDSDKVILL